jgi:hypothetical protein
MRSEKTNEWQHLFARGIIFSVRREQAMLETMVFIILLVLIPMVLQLMAVSVYWNRLARSLRRAADKPPFTTVVSLAALGPSPRAVARLLDRATRLDADEIDTLIEAQGGDLPLPMSRPAAQRLAYELKQLGAVVDLHFVAQAGA